MSFLCLFYQSGIPFIPIQITLIDACIEAYPSFFTIVESNTRQIHGRFLPSALTHAAPFGITVTAMIALTNFLAPFSASEQQTVMYLLLILISMSAVVKSCIPFSPLRAFLCVTMVLGTFGAILLLPSLFEVQTVSAGMGIYILAGIIAAIFLIMLLESIAYRFGTEWKRRICVMIRRKKKKEAKTCL